MSRGTDTQVGPERNEAPPARHHALIPAAGSGSRIGAQVPKQYLQLAGQPMLWHSVARLARSPRIDSVHLVLAPDDEHFERLDWREFEGRLTVHRCGGASRAESVRNGLRAMRDTVADEDWVLVHDAARPCLSEALLNRLIDALAGDTVGGLLAMPLADTLKRAGDFHRIDRTEVRDGLWQAQTPQMFHYAILVRALARWDGAAPTDEAGAVEALGLAPRLISSDLRNLKVTFPEDQELAELILLSQQRR